MVRDFAWMSFMELLQLKLRDMNNIVGLWFGSNGLQELKLLSATVGMSNSLTLGWTPY